MTALLIVDLQNDFLPRGALPVADGDQIIPVVNLLMSRKFDLVVASLDWHPAEHGSFAENHPDMQVGDVIDLNGTEQILWPAHCVIDTLGAQLAPDLKKEKIDHLVYKGTDPEIDSYSAFFDNGHRKDTGLTHVLKSHGITDVYVVGLATDYCVKFTVLDACLEGFRTYVVADGCRGVEMKAGDCARAFEEMKQAGAIVLVSSSEMHQ
ncbi:MAG: bifunctional nicotinamidase/pyrazinamidase [Chlamydiales bacterium]|nr:bifunctional nicotinamidase/pyrazinamidase [Chlamydiia bacterium]MCP5506869.1 bifunctional nicotinamidase/pyrazinamidase [Chlamydiales bacterium]